MKSSWTLEQIPAQTGRRAIVTGGNSGIGFHTALELARAGAEVVVASRSRDKGVAAVERINQAVGAPRAQWSILDLASLSSVREFADRELAREAPLHLLINNAGVMAPPERLETRDGFELQFGTNVLGHFALTALLMPALDRAAAEDLLLPPRIVTVASIAHKGGTLHFDDLQYRDGYVPMKSYRQSKLANLVLALELDRRLRASGSPVLSVAAHPGVANTNLFQAGNYGAAEKALRRLLGLAIRLLMNSARQGALPTLYAATSADAVSGGYFGPQGFRETRGGDVGPAEIAPQAKDLAAARRLWSACEDLTGIRLLD